jgi:hypothetical protein
MDSPWSATKDLNVDGQSEFLRNPQMPTRLAVTQLNAERLPTDCRTVRQNCSSSSAAHRTGCGRLHRSIRTGTCARGFHPVLMTLDTGRNCFAHCG